jgi:hypothetical protein
VCTFEEVVLVVDATACNLVSDLHVTM